MNPRLNEISTRLGELPDELSAVNDADEFDEARFNELTAEFDKLVAERTRIESIEKTRAVAEAAIAADAAAVSAGDSRDARNMPIPGVKGNDPFDLSNVRMFAPNATAELRARAHTAIESTVRDGWELTDDQAQRVDRILRTKDDRNGSIARRVLGTGTEAYKSAFAKYLTGRESQFTTEERMAVERVMSLGTTTEGGFAAPFPIDPTLVISGDGSSNPFRQIGRVEQITSDSWQGLSAGATAWAFEAEAAQADDVASTFAQPQVKAHKAQGVVPASIEIVGDYPNIATDLQRLFAEGKDDLEATKFAVGAGDGSNEPFGIVTAIDGTGNDITSVVADTYDASEVYRVFETLGPKYRSRATWAMNVGIINLTRQEGTAVGHAFLTDFAAGSPPNLLGRPLVEASGMDGTVTALSHNNVVVFGDFSNYLIADRVGFSVEYIPHLFATANNLPSGQRAWYGWWRVGADSINDDAFVLLNVT